MEQRSIVAINRIVVRETGVRMNGHYQGGGVRQLRQQVDQWDRTAVVQPRGHLLK